MLESMNHSKMIKVQSIEIGEKYAYEGYRSKAASSSIIGLRPNSCTSRAA